MNGTQYKVKLVAIGGIPDKYFSTPITTFYSGQQHYNKYIYLPIQTPDGKTWLSQNLGSPHSRLGDPNFDPGKKYPYNPHGNPANQILIETKIFRLLSDHSGFAYVASSNNYYSERSRNPCPDGYRLPTRDEFKTSWHRYPHLPSIPYETPALADSYYAVKDPKYYYHRQTCTRKVKVPCTSYSTSYTSDCYIDEEYDCSREDFSVGYVTQSPPSNELKAFDGLLHKERGLWEPYLSARCIKE